MYSAHTIIVSRIAAIYIMYARYIALLLNFELDLQYDYCLYTANFALEDHSMVALFFGSRTLHDVYGIRSNSSAGTACYEYLLALLAQGSYVVHTLTPDPLT